MSKWEMVKLGDIGDFKSGGTPARGKLEYFEGNIPWITTVSLGKTLIDERDAVEHISADAVANSASKIISKNSIMVGSRVGVGKVSINTVPMCTNQDIISIENIDEQKVYKKYIVHCIKSYKHFFDTQKRGATIQGINSGVLKSLNIPLPPLDTQKKIAETLDTVAELLAMRKQQLAEMDNLIKSTFYDMFGDPFENPKGWNLCQLSDLASIIMGQSPNGSSYNEEGEGTPLLNGPTEFGDKYPTEKQWTLKPTKMCQKDDILFCVRGATAGRMNISDKEYCIGRGLAAIRPKQYHMQGFIYLYLQMMYSHFQSTSNGSTFINISKDQLYKLPYLEVDNKIQEKFSNIFTKIEEQKALVKKAIDETQYLFDSLMSEYFE